MTQRLFLRLDGDPLYAPETGVPAGAMRDHVIPGPLAAYVSSLISYRESIAAGEEVEERILPDGAVRLVFDFGDAAASGAGAGASAVAIAASTSPAVLRLRGRIEGISIALRPGAVAAVLGVPAGEIAGQAVALDDLWQGQASAVLEELARATGELDRTAILQAALAARLGGNGNDDAAVRRQALRALDLIAASDGQVAQSEIAEALGVGERRLQQIFHAQVGLSPRSWRRLIRMHACLRALRRYQAPCWAQVAAAAGFYDQSHLVNEFKALCGLTPGLFLKRRTAGSSKTTA